MNSLKTFVGKIMDKIFSQGKIEAERRSLLGKLQDFLFELVELMEKYEDHAKAFLDYGQKWLNKHSHVIKILKTVMIDLKTKDRNVRISRLVGSSVSLVGCGGILLAPLTGGASVAIAAASLMSAAAGTVTTLGARIVGAGIEAKNMSDVKDIINVFSQETLYLSSLIRCFAETEKNVDTFLADNDHLIKLAQNEFSDTEVITQKQINTCLEHIHDGNANIQDYCIVIKFWASNNFVLFKAFKRHKVHSTMEIRRISISLIPRLGIAKRLKGCVNILKTRDSAQVARLASKRVSILVSAVADVFEIVSSAKHIITNNESAAIKNIKDIIAELEVQGSKVKKFLHEHE